MANHTHRDQPTFVGLRPRAHKPILKIARRLSSLALMPWLCWGVPNYARPKKLSAAALSFCKAGTRTAPPGANGTETWKNDCTLFNRDSKRKAPSTTIY